METARLLVADTRDRAGMVASNHTLGMAHLFETQLAAWTGDIATARQATERANTPFAAGGVSIISLEIPAALGLLELSLLMRPLPDPIGSVYSHSSAGACSCRLRSSPPTLFSGVPGPLPSL